MRRGFRDRFIRTGDASGTRARASGLAEVREPVVVVVLGVDRAEALAPDNIVGGVHSEASKADWESPAEVKAAYRAASIVGNDRVVFNIGGNKYRLVVRINYAYRVIYIRFVGTHGQYDRINVQEV